MRNIRFVQITALLLVIILTGCGEKSASLPAPSSASATPAHSQAPFTTPTVSVDVEKPPALSREQTLDLLMKGSEVDRSFYGAKSYTKEEAYTYYEAYFTHNYVDTIVLKSDGNMKQEGDSYKLAHENSEFIEGTYYEGHFDEKTKVEQIDSKSIQVTNSLGDGLYAPHKEIITLIYDKNGWKINNLKWE
jgi:hypothetical protein